MSGSSQDSTLAVGSGWLQQGPNWHLASWVLSPPFFLWYFLSRKEAGRTPTATFTQKVPPLPTPTPPPGAQEWKIRERTLYAPLLPTVEELLPLVLILRVYLFCDGFWDPVAPTSCWENWVQSHFWDSSTDFGFCSCLSWSESCGKEYQAFQAGPRWDWM